MHRHHVRRGYASMQDRMPIELSVGPNEILLKIGQAKGAGGFCGHLRDESGQGRDRASRARGSYDRLRVTLQGTSIRPLVISAPFGIYVQPRGATPTLGTFTAHRRPGRWWRTVTTVRYYRRIGAWVNRIGLRNPGIEWLVARAGRGDVDLSDKIVSIHGFTNDEWWVLLEHAHELEPLAIELNMSCPNVGEIDWPQELFARAIATGVRTIVKIPPVNYHDMVHQALGAGVRTLHCCNTIPVPAGGVSGKPLKPVALQCIRDVLSRASSLGIDDLGIIGGGGITGAADIDEYAEAGARHVAIGTLTMNPLRLISKGPLRGLIEHAEARFGPCS